MADSSTSNPSKWAQSIEHLGVILATLEKLNTADESSPNYSDAAALALEAENLEIMETKVKKIGEQIDLRIIKASNDLQQSLVALQEKMEQRKSAKGGKRGALTPLNKPSTPLTSTSSPNTI